MNPLDLTGRTYLVTGASSGIGRDTAVLLSELGASVVLAGRDETRLSQTRSLLQGAAHYLAPFDLAQTEAIPGWMASFTRESGPLHGFVHAAGLHAAVPIRAMSVARIETLMRANVYSAFMLAKGLRQKG